MDIKSRCENLRDRYKEVEIEQQKLDNFKFEPESYQEDVVTGSDSEFPYGKHHFKIRGYGSVEYPKRKQALREKISRIKDEIAEVERFIESVEDVETRNILTMYYELGMTHEQIADEYGYERSTVTKKINDFWAKR